MPCMLRSCGHLMSLNLRFQLPFLLIWVAGKVDPRHTVNKRGARVQAFSRISHTRTCHSQNNCCKMQKNFELQTIPQSFANQTLQTPSNTLRHLGTPANLRSPSNRKVHFFKLRSFAPKCARLLKSALVVRCVFLPPD